MQIDERAYQHALEMNKGKTFSVEGGADECFRYFISCYEAKRAQQPVELTGPFYSYKYHPEAGSGDRETIGYRGEDIADIHYRKKDLAKKLIQAANAHLTQPKRESGGDVGILIRSLKRLTPINTYVWGGDNGDEEFNVGDLAELALNEYETSNRSSFVTGDSEKM